MKDNGLLFSYYDISYETDLGLTERLSQALQELAQGLVLERLIRLIRLPRRRNDFAPTDDRIDSKQRKCFSATGDARRKEEKPPGLLHRLADNRKAIPFLQPKSSKPSFQQC